MLNGQGAGATGLSGNNTATIVDATGSTSTVEISGLTISGGGGASGAGVMAGGALTVTDSTVSGNSGAAGAGGVYSPYPVTLRFATIAGNTGPLAANIVGDGSPVLTSVGSVIATDATSSCAGLAPDPASSYNATLVGDPSCGFTGPTNISPSWAAINLGSLALNGNPNGTMTMLPGAGSALIGVVPNATGQTAIGPNATDQRGATRNGLFWIGAAQQSPGPLTFGSGAFPSATVGTPSNLTVTVTNTGIDAATPSAITPAGTGVAVTGGSCATGTLIAAGGTCTVNLAWTPAAAGALTGGSLTIAYPDGANPADTLALSGTATSTPGPTPTPTPTGDTTPTPTGGVAQSPGGGCVTAGNTDYIPGHGTKRLMKPRCITNAGQRVGAAVEARLRSDARSYNLYCLQNNGSTTKTRSTGFGNGSRYCKKGALKFRNHDQYLQITVTWYAPATATYAAYSYQKTYRT